jgi:hypothetical protein
MSSSARKKEKHRLKRKEKKHQLQKVHSRTALQRLAAEGGRLECWIMPKDWKEYGIATMRVLGRAPGGRAATAVFLVDFWAVGLKDAFGRSDVPELEFREGSLDPWIEKTGAVKLDEETARRMIAGAVRFGRQNGFRMPPAWEKFVVIFGRSILDQIPTADLSDFGIDGGLRYVGTMDFLKTRLTMPPREFLTRPDVHYVMEAGSRLVQSDDDDAEDENEDEEDSDTIESVLEMTNAGASVERLREVLERAEEEQRDAGRLVEGQLIAPAEAPAAKGISGPG